MLEAIISVLGVGMLAVIGWVFQLGNRVTILEIKGVGLRELIEAKFDEIGRRLERIEKAMNSHIGGN